MRHGVGERVELGVELAQLGGAFAHALLQRFVQPLDLAVAAQAHQFGPGAAGKNGKQRLGLGRHLDGVCPQCVDDAKGGSVGVAQRLPHVGLKAGLRLRGVVGEMPGEIVGVDHQARLVDRLATGHVVDVEAEIGAFDATARDRERAHLPLRAQFAHHDHVGPQRLGHVAGEFTEEGFTGVPRHTARDGEQLRLAQFFRAGVDRAGQHAFFAVDLDEFGPEPGIGHAAVLAPHADVVPMHVLFAAQPLHERGALPGAGPGTGFQRRPALEFVAAVALQAVPGDVGLQVGAVRKAGDGHVQGAEAEGLGEALFGAAQALGRLGLQADVGHRGDDQLVFGVVAQLGRNQGIEGAAVGPQACDGLFRHAAQREQAPRMGFTLGRVAPEKMVGAPQSLLAGVAVAALKRRVHVQDQAGAGRLGNHGAGVGAEDEREAFQAAVAFLLGALAQFQFLHLPVEGLARTHPAVEHHDAHQHQGGRVGEPYADAHIEAGRVQPAPRFRVAQQSQRRHAEGHRTHQGRAPEKDARARHRGDEQHHPGRAHGAVGQHREHRREEHREHQRMRHVARVAPAQHEQGDPSGERDQGRCDDLPRI